MYIGISGRRELVIIFPPTLVSLFHNFIIFELLPEGGMPQEASRGRQKVVGLFGSHLQPMEQQIGEQLSWVLFLVSLFLITARTS